MTVYLDKTASLPPASQEVIINKATEYPHSGNYIKPIMNGTYLCRRCGLALFRGTSQFDAGCGWPSFDDNIAANVTQQPDKDKQRTEIICTRCKAHLGHVFTGEYFTEKNKRHCVNSLSLDFVANDQVLDTEEAIIAGGCFWGVEHFMRLLTGVLNVEVGYIGGNTSSPSYEQVCSGNTGHYEAVRVIFDKNKINYMAVIKRFFEIHDPTQGDGQGADKGLQYQSAVFYYNNEQLMTVKQLIAQLQAKGYQVVTRLLTMQPFWPAEHYHQAYYQKHNKLPYCHRPQARFD